MTKYFAMKNKPSPTAAQRSAFRRSTSFGVLFVRSQPINEAVGSNGYVKARNAGEPVVVSLRRFGSLKEAILHGKRFKRIEKHKAFYPVMLNLTPNAWVNFKTGKTNPVIGAKRTNRR